MDTFYTIIKIAPNSRSDDSLSIGLLLSDGKKYWLRFSEQRKNATKGLMSDNAKSIDFIEKQISRYIQKTNSDIENSKETLFPLDALLSSDYFNYLHSYSNGFLRFSQPSFLNDTITEDKFSQLFSLLIDDTAIELPKKKDITSKKFYAAIDKDLIGRVEGRIHTKISINNELLPSMYFKYEMDCIGRNGVFVGAKSILFNKTNQTLIKDISNYIALISLLSTTYDKDIKKNNFFLIANEPSKIGTPEHNTWEEVNNNPLFKVVNSEEVSIIADKVEQTKAKTFFDNLPSVN